MNNVRDYMLEDYFGDERDAQELVVQQITDEAYMEWMTDGFLPGGHDDGDVNFWLISDWPDCLSELQSWYVSGNAKMLVDCAERICNKRKEIALDIIRENCDA